MTQPNPQLIDTKEVARILGVSVKTVRRMIDAGKLPRPKRIGRLLRWRLSDINRYADRL